MTNIRRTEETALIPARIGKNNKQFFFFQTQEHKINEGKTILKERRMKKFYLSVVSQILRHVKKVDV